MTPLGWIKKIWNLKGYISIEPILICWVLPSCLLIVAMENLELEKTCRVNLGLDEIICDNMINRSLNAIDCSDLDEVAVPVEGMTLISKNETVDEIMKLGDDRIVFDNWNETLNNLTQNVTAAMNNETMNLTTTMGIILKGGEQSTIMTIQELTKKVCKAEQDSQKVLTVIKGYRAPIAAIFPIIIILFAGGWSDKKNLRKPCMLLPLIGELLGCIALFISAIFMLQLPMEFGSILEKLLPAITGSSTLMLMGLYSYLTVITTEENRTLRFGILTIVVSVVPLIAIPFSAPLYNSLGYIYLFLICIIIYLIGILYIMFAIKEVKEKKSEDEVDNENHIQNGVENLAFEDRENSKIATSNQQVAENGQTGSSPTTPVKKSNFFVEFFDPTLAMDCVRVLLRKREGNKRAVIYMLVIAYLIFVGPSISEPDYIYQFSRVQLGWQGIDYGNFATYTTAIVLAGTLLMVGLFSKIFKMSDPMIGIISTLGTVISRPISAFSSTTLMYYIGNTFDLFLGTRPVAMKSIISVYVDENELGRIYSILGIMDALDQFIFPPIYSLIYFHTVETFPGAFYLFSDVFFIPTLIIFIIIYIIFKRTHFVNKEPEAVDEKTQVPTFAETTHM